MDFPLELLINAIIAGVLLGGFYVAVTVGISIAFGMLDSAIEPLQARGAVFILCNNALNFWVGRLAAGGAGKAETIRADLLAHLLPKVVVVPAMVVAISKAQEKGLTYKYLG